MATCLLVSCSVASGTASAAVYRWVDEAGQVHFSDTPPTSNAQALEFAPGTAAQAARRDQAAAAANESAVQQADCDAARAQLSQYESALRVVERDADGNERELSQSERATLLETAAAKVQADCEGVQ